MGRRKIEGPCAVGDCDAPIYARGWCLKHYYRWVRNGDPLHLTYGRIDPVERFWSMVEKTDGCWNWTAYPHTGGYGRIVVDGVPVAAHRFAYELLVGPIPEGLQIDHRCHDPQVCQLGTRCPHRRCVNPAHLLPTTLAVNSSAERRSSPERSQTHCWQNHPFDEKNTYYYEGGRHCRECKRERDRRYRAAAAISA